jgi:hypothetical protein
MAPELLWAGTAMAAAHGITNRVDIYRCVRACVRGVGGWVNAFEAGDGPFITPYVLVLIQAGSFEDTVKQCYGRVRFGCVSMCAKDHVHQ